MTELLLDYARELGLVMGSIASEAHQSRHVGWTTDEALASKLRAAGATVVNGYGADDVNAGIPMGRDPKSEDTPMGWDVSFRQGAEVASHG